MIIVDHRIAEIVVLIAILQNRAVQMRALRQTQTLGEAARRNVSHDDLDGHDGNAAHNAVAIIELLDEVRFDAMLFKHLEQVIAD